jgi:hypothetical protein
MTIPRSRLAPVAAALEEARAGAVDGDFDALVMTAEAGREDRIGLSARASMLIAAGLALRAYVCSGIEDVRQRVALGRGRWLVVESGLYGVTS